MSFFPLSVESVLKNLYAARKAATAHAFARATDLDALCAMYEAEFQVKASILDALRFDLSPAVMQNYVTAWSLQCFIDAKRVKELEATLQLKP